MIICPTCARALQREATPTTKGVFECGSCGAVGTNCGRDVGDVSEFEVRLSSKRTDTKVVSGMGMIEEKFLRGEISAEERNRLAGEHIAKVYGISTEPESVAKEDP